MKKKPLSQTGEFGFIGLLQKKIKPGQSVVMGIGDDAAVLKSAGNGRLQLFTTDMLIEDRHFKLKNTTGFEIGRKALAVNVSDIAAMGGVPTHAVIAAGFPASMPLSFVMEIYRGIESVAKEFSVNIVGGDTNRSEKLVLSVALLGEAEKNELVTRSGAKEGDVIFVSGFLGGSYQSGRHLNFTPRLKESRYLVENFKINAMMDISDGLSSDLHRLAKASGVGALISAEAVPVSRDAKGLKAALTEGEDFELLFTLSVKEAARLTLDSRRRGYVLFSPVGRVVSKKQGIKLVHATGRAETLEESGFDHFKK